jgi:hypothetical protein
MRRLWDNERISLLPKEAFRKYVIDWKEELFIDRLYLEKNGAILSGHNQKGKRITADRLAD